MMANDSSKRIATSQVLIMPAPATLIVAERPGRREVRLEGTMQFYIGASSTVTLQTGFKVLLEPAGEDNQGLAPIVLETSAAIYGITDNSQVNVYVLELF